MIRKLIPTLAVALWASAALAQVSITGVAPGNMAGGCPSGGSICDIGKPAAAVPAAAQPLSQNTKITANHTVAAAEMMGVDFTSGAANVTVTLPQAGSTGFEANKWLMFEIDGPGNATLQIAPPPTGTGSVFVGLPNTSASSLTAITVFWGAGLLWSDGTNWHINGGFML